MKGTLALVLFQLALCDTVNGSRLHAEETALLRDELMRLHLWWECSTLNRARREGSDTWLTFEESRAIYWAWRKLQPDYTSPATIQLGPES